YKGKCENIHGHNWKVQVSVVGQRLNEIGIAIDFHELKSITNQVINQLDHKNLNEIPPFTDINPSSEHIACWIFDSIKDRLSGHKNIKLSSVTVWESNSASATYSEE
ncbi:MAG: 6-carboxytetrahydropterin synthase, partial [Thermodesulfovibrionales bacterium]|nr:6-carboxytetrahydropterin synthase [Thermodesulfovibrionales bacterium]